jgi:co-chaperonin GroES (HSP10)
MLKPYMDNVVVVMEPLPATSKGGISLAHLGKANLARSARAARVLASGPGYWRDPTYQAPKGVFVPNEVKEGARVLVTATAGQDYSMDLNAPRHNKTPEFRDACGVKGEFRILREQEILGVLAEDVDVGTVQL